MFTSIIKDMCIEQNLMALKGGFVYPNNNQSNFNLIYLTPYINQDTSLSGYVEIKSGVYGYSTDNDFVFETWQEEMNCLSVWLGIWFYEVIPADTHITYQVHNGDEYLYWDGSSWVPIVAKATGTVGATIFNTTTNYTFEYSVDGIVQTPIDVTAGATTAIATIVGELNTGFAGLLIASISTGNKITITHADTDTASSFEILDGNLNSVIGFTDDTQYETNWNTSLQVKNGFTSFPLTNKQIKFKVWLLTDSSTVTPQFMGIRFIYKGIYDFYTDIINQSLVDEIKNNIHPVGKIQLRKLDTPTTAATITGSIGSTTFDTTTNKTFEYELNGVVKTSIVVTSGATTPIATIITDLNTGFSGLIVASATVENKVKLTHSSLGSPYTFKVLAGTLNDAVGLTDNVTYAGISIYNKIILDSSKQTRYNIATIEAVYNLTDNVGCTTDLYGTWDNATKTITLTADVLAAKEMLVYVAYELEVLITAHVDIDYSEYPQSPYLKMSVRDEKKTRRDFKNMVLMVTEANKARAIKSYEFCHLTMDIEVFSDKSQELNNIMGIMDEYFLHNSYYQSKQTGDYYSIYGLGGWVMPGNPFTPTNRWSATNSFVIGGPKWGGIDTIKPIFKGDPNLADITISSNN
jgi:hypothetical protein